MTRGDNEVESDWNDLTTVTQWASSDTRDGVLELPRQIAINLVRRELGEPDLVVDVGGGPGSFLSAFLAPFSTTRGIWYDVSEPMMALAKERLARYDDRVSFTLAGFEDTSKLPTNVDVIITSRALHHLSVSQVFRFYAEAADRLSRRGWLINLDHVGLAEPWSERLLDTYLDMVPGAGSQPTHEHKYRFATVSEHFDALRAAGLTDVDMPWRAFGMCLFMARRPIDGGGDVG